jgi:hypothetical protein
VIEIKGRKHYEFIDYVGVPFHGVRCHAYGILVGDCALNMWNKIWQKKELDNPKLVKQEIGHQKRIYLY